MYLQQLYSISTCVFVGNFLILAQIHSFQSVEGGAGMKYRKKRRLNERYERDGGDFVISLNQGISR